MKSLKETFKKYPIVAAYLFGSRAIKKQGPLSDYDFGIQLSRRVSKNQYLTLRLKLMRDIARALQKDQIDVVIYNESPLLLQYEILKGNLIYECKPAERARMMFETLRLYLDWQYYEKKFARAFIRRIATKGLHG